MEISTEDCRLVAQGLREAADRRRRTAALGAEKIQIEEDQERKVSGSLALVEIMAEAGRLDTLAESFDRVDSAPVAPQRPALSIVKNDATVYSKPAPKPLIGPIVLGEAEIDSLIKNPNDDDPESDLIDDI